MTEGIDKQKPITIASIIFVMGVVGGGLKIYTDLGKERRIREEARETEQVKAIEEDRWKRSVDALLDGMGSELDARGPTVSSTEKFQREDFPTFRLQIENSTKNNLTAIDGITERITALASRVADDEEVDREHRLEVFPDEIKRIDSALTELRGKATEMHGDLERLTSEVEKNTQDHVDQKHRANTRAGVRLVRDSRISHNEGRLEELEKLSDSVVQSISNISVMDSQVERVAKDISELDEWRGTLSVGREEILEGQIRAMQAEISAIKAALDSTSGGM